SRITQAGPHSSGGTARCCVTRWRPRASASTTGSGGTSTTGIGRRTRSSTSPSRRSRRLRRPGGQRLRCWPPRHPTPVGGRSGSSDGARGRGPGGGERRRRRVLVGGGTASAHARGVRRLRRAPAPDLGRRLHRRRAGEPAEGGAEGGGAGGRRV